MKSFPKDDPSQEPHLTAFMAYKAGCTHIVRDVEKPNSKLHKKEACEAVTILECPPMIVAAVVGYVPTANGYLSKYTVWSQHLSDEMKRRFYKRWYKCQKKAFKSYAKKYADGQTEIEDTLRKMKEECVSIRLLAHTQISKTPLKQKKSHCMEIQVLDSSSLRSF